jgi:hypothetical protein
VTEQLLSVGVVVVHNVPRKEGECVKMADLLSTLRPTEWGNSFDVKYVYVTLTQIQTVLTSRPHR